jgi:hypothetical protein
MALALHARDLDQGRLGNDRRAAQQRAGDQNFIFAHQQVDQRGRRVAEHGQALGKVGSRSDFRVRNEAGQDAVEQIDMRGLELSGTGQKQFRDFVRGIGAAPRIAVLDDVIETGDQRRGPSHRHTRNAVRRQISGNLSGLCEGRVRPEKSSLWAVRPLPYTLKTAISAAT